jgi:DNA-binding NtrC family response regulator
MRSEARVMVTSHVPLEQLVAEGKLGEDLMYRLLDGGEIRLPPLWDRVEDLEELLDLALVRGMDGGRQVGLAAEARAILRSYRWPGNVREVFGELRGAAAGARGRVIERRHPGERILPPSQRRFPCRLAKRGAGDCRDSSEEAEREPGGAGPQAGPTDGLAPAAGAGDRGEAAEARSLTPAHP